MSETIIPRASQTPPSSLKTTRSTIDRAAAALAGRLASHLSYGTLVVRDSGGSVRYGTGRADQPLAEVTVTDGHAFSSVLRRGSVGLGQSYVEGWWECDDLTALVRILLRNLEGLGRLADRTGASSLRRFRRRPRDRQTDRRDVQAHYDLGNEFFELMLDSTMMYSSAVFDSDGLTLLEGSMAKLERICRRLELGPGDHVVEIGTGWGGFAIYAASRYGCRVTTTTISDAQYRLAAKRVADAGLGGQIEVRNDDYRDLTGTYDKLVSIEMIEAIGWRQLDTFFAACSGLIADRGLMALQAIVIADQSYERAKHHDDFIKRMIFPGGCLPSIEAIASSCARVTDLRLVHLDDIGVHYAETLRRWRSNVEDHLDEISAMGLGDSFQRLWRLYLCYCEAAFMERHVSDVQMILAKPRWRPSSHGVEVGDGSALRRGGPASRSTASTA